MSKQKGTLFPGCPPDEMTAIAEHTAVEGASRRPDGGGTGPGQEALTAAVIAAVRRNHTGIFDELLANELFIDDVLGYRISG